MTPSSGPAHDTDACASNRPAQVYRGHDNGFPFLSAFDCLLYVGFGEAVWRDEYPFTGLTGGMDGEPLQPCLPTLTFQIASTPGG